MEQTAATPNPIAPIVAMPIESRPAADALMEEVGAIPLVIADQETNAAAGALVKKLRTMGKRLDDELKSFTGPINQGVKALREKYRLVTDPIATLQADLGRRQTAYMEEQEHLRAMEEAAARKIQDDAAMEQAVKAEDLGEPEAAEQVLENAQRMPAPIMRTPPPARSEEGTLTVMRDNWTWAEEDISKVPIEYHMLNSAMVTKAVKSGGVREIPGIRIFNDRKAVAR